MSFITLGYADVALAAILLIANAVLSLALGLGLARPLLIAAVRMVVQLLLIGLVLKALFALASPLWTGVAVAVMMLVASREIMARQQRRLRGAWGFGLGAASMMSAGLIVTVLALTTAIRPDPWYDPRYALPLLGMVLGNTMNGVSLALFTMFNAASRERTAIEARLALGEERGEALAGPRQEALRAGLTPIINSMSVSGVVALPGMMTGQILAGVDPVEAVKYQLLIMFLIAGGTGFGVLAAVFGGLRRLTDERHRLRLDRLMGLKEKPRA
ncbi:MAG TPA: iron export ABC transporter permease subunit FetB [Rhodospirillales bacterium]|nr:iron export ABC transporter permease subunit FetB [Rhodospirillales bacterium]